MAARPDSLDTLRGVDVPALVVVGAEDALASAADAQAMVDALPRGRLVTIPRSGHLSAVETPEEFTSAVRELLTSS
jgi:pimeloyl-ACP methyl ester carboxylesterase